MEDVHGMPWRVSACSTVHGAFFLGDEEDTWSTTPKLAGRLNVVASCGDVGFTHASDGMSIVTSISNGKYSACRGMVGYAYLYLGCSFREIK